MAAIKVSSKVDEKVWKSLQKYSEETHRSLSGLLTEAVEDYLKRKTMRDDVLKHLDTSILENEELGKLLAK